MTDSNRPTRPTREQIEALPAFEGLPLERIHLLQTPAQFDEALQACRRERHIGFDTESKPTFTRDAVRSGPHVVQFALRDRAFIVQVGDATPLEFLKTVIESTDMIKVGFGLVSDRGLLRGKLGIELGAIVELSQALRVLRYKEDLGVKAAVAVVLGQRMSKSRSVTTSNWAVPDLKPAQLLYAANDAYAALAVFHAMGLAEPAA
ncbi:3'-5' exonuclease [soil metagenome]